MTKKHSIGFVKQYLNNYGYGLFLDEYIDSKNRMVMADEEEYKYFLTFDFFRSAMKNKSLPWRFDSGNPFTVENIKKWVSLSEKNFILISDKYTKSRDRNLIFYCLSCEKEWKTCWNDISSNGRECPNCQKSYGESKISSFFDKNEIEYFYQYRFPACKFKQQLPFDFYIQKFNCCIEYNGIQHYKPIDFSGKGNEWANNEYSALLKRDKIKIEYCKKNNIKLIIVSYLDFENINKILDKEINSI
jgi:hypothetical protein